MMVVITAYVRFQTLLFLSFFETLYSGGFSSTEKICL
jgi:hypothetical protein